MLKMDQVHVLRHKVLSEGQSIRRVARELGFKPQHGSQVSGPARTGQKFSASAGAAGMGSGQAAAGGVGSGVGAANDRQATHHGDAPTSSAQGGRLSNRQDAGG